MEAAGGPHDPGLRTPSTADAARSQRTSGISRNAKRTRWRATTSSSLARSASSPAVTRMVKVPAIAAAFTAARSPPL